MTTLETPQPAGSVTLDPPAKSRADRAHWGWWVAFAILAIGFASIAVESAIHFDDTPIDGPFQLFNALRRLAAGQRFGGTFQFFHGPGIPYLHLLPFYLFGGDFFASELARQLVSITAALAVFLAFFRAWTGSWREGLPFAVVAIIALIPLRVNALLFPINSMLGLRSTMPLVVAIHLLRRRPGWRTDMERGALFAITIACGIEQGSATIAAFVLVLTFLALRQRDPRQLTHAAASVVVGGVCFVVMLFAMTPHGVASVLRFNFKSLPGDQFWYFGAPPNRFLFRWAQFAALGANPAWTVLVFAMVGWTLIRLWRQSKWPSDRQIAAEGFLAVYAVLSTTSILGTFAMVYFQPAVRVALILAMLAARREWALHKRELHVSDKVRNRIPAYATMALIGYSIAGWPLASISVIRTPLHIVYAHGVLHDSATMTPKWIETTRTGLAVMRYERNQLHREPVIWSTYASYIEWKSGTFNPSFDYIIHALGPDNRAAYAKRFVEVKPDVVQTLRPTYANYEEWLEVNHWNFYRPLLRDYFVAAEGPWSFFWLRRPKAGDEAPQLIADASIPPNQLGIALDGRGVAAGDIGLFEVTLSYHVINPLRRIPVVGSLPRYLVYVTGAANHSPISLAPYATQRVFPVVTVGPSEIHLLGAVTTIIGNARLVFDSIRVERLRVPPDNLRWAAEFVAGPKKDTLPNPEH